jgi:hypothetical protein
MKDYPSIPPSSKAPRQHCIGFDKLDGTNVRVKYTQKRGFHLFGTKSELFDHTHPIFGAIPALFEAQIQAPLTKFVRKEFPNEREIYAFFEFFGPSSFAGSHVKGEPKQLVLLDILLAKREEFMLPQEFVKRCAPILPTPKVVYTGNLNDQLIQDVREGKYNLNEGMLCKGTKASDQYHGKIWMAKIKTHDYFRRLKETFGQKWEQYGE